MKIADIKVYHVQPRWLMIKVETEEGIVGWGEGTLEGKSLAVEQVIEQLKGDLIGQDCRNIEHLYHMMYRGGFYRCGAIATSAISGIEQALWDIKGKWLNVPVWQLLGGKCRDRIRMYAHVSPGTLMPSNEELMEATKKRISQGFTALKTAPFAPLRHIETLETVEKIVNQFAVIRETAGKNIDIAIDFHGRVSPALAPILFERLAEYHPMFIEEPILPENVEAMSCLAKKTTIPIATGERLMTTFQFREIIEKQAAMVIQPDISHCGGILQAFKIAAMAENYYCSIAPHNPLGPLALASTLQLDTCIHNFTAQEHPTMEDGRDLGVGILKKPFVINDGYIEVPKGAGLGVEVDEIALSEILYHGKWSNPILYNQDDHSIAEW
ncbi:MAG: galactonate dehydratase [Eubacteriales bacterium]